jgi:ABC-type Fe3+ transport system permease subunit
MADMQSNSTFSEKMRRIRFRRNRERTRFRDELKIIPKWLIVTVIVLFLAAEAGFFLGNVVFHQMSNPSGEVFPFPNNVPLSIVSVFSMVLAGAICFSTFLFAVAYVNRDAKRRNMNSALWTILVVVLSPGWMALGFLIYFLMREPLPYNCPQCGATVGARFNYCPNCKCNLQPSCPQCKREVGELDKFCPFCAFELKSPAPPSVPPLDPLAAPPGTP